MAEVSIITQTCGNTMGTGSTTKEMARECLSTLMEASMTVSGSKEKSKAMENLHGPIVTHIKVCGTKESVMDKEFSRCKMEK